MRNANVLIVLVLFLLLNFPALGFEISSPDLRKHCEALMETHPGTIIVYDLKTNSFPALVNPTIAFQRAYKPGSFFKMITAASLMENGKIDAGQRINCKNFFQYRGASYNCSIPVGHGEQNLIQAISNSCNIFFYHHSPRLTISEINKTASQFGCGRSLSVPGNAVKTIPGKCEPPDDPRRFVEFSVGNDDGIQITPWQAANITAIIATGKPVSPDIPSPRLSGHTLSVLRKGMREASDSGTCSLIGKSGINAAGKTGTSTNYKNPSRYHGWFAGYLPADNPRYIIVVFFEDGRGYSDAVPVGVKVMKALLGLF
jgi:penicillin-binding protein 2